MTPMTLGLLVPLALGEAEARKVDYAIPHEVMMGLTHTAREDVAGWYYDAPHRLMGRLLTKTECWREVLAGLQNGTIRAHLYDTDITYWAKAWPCLRQHAERGEIALERQDAVAES
jgi:hypothetical protein